MTLNSLLPPSTDFKQTDPKGILGSANLVRLEPEADSNKQVSKPVTAILKKLIYKPGPVQILGSNRY